MRSGLTTKVSHAADNVNRNSGTESVIGVGSGDWLGHNIVIILLLVQTLWLLCEKQKNAAAKHDRHQDIINDTILCGRMAGGGWGVVLGSAWVRARVGCTGNTCE